MTLTGRLVEPPPGARKVPSFKLWVTEDGTAYGPYGKRAVSDAPSPTLSAVDDTGREFSVSLAQMVARAWLPPKPPRSKLVHLDGNRRNNAASNLAWKENKTNAQRCADWKRNALSQLQRDPADPRHGTRTGWRAGCKCTRCRNAGAAYRRILETRKTIREMEELCRTIAR